LEFNVPFQHKYSYIRDKEITGLIVRTADDRFTSVLVKTTVKTHRQDRTGQTTVR